MCWPLAWGRRMQSPQGFLQRFKFSCLEGRVWTGEGGRGGRGGGEGSEAAWRGQCGTPPVVCEAPSDRMAALSFPRALVEVKISAGGSRVPEDTHLEGI